MYLCFSCSNVKHNEVDSCIITPKENIQQYLDSFIQQNKNKDVYELYIDKIDDDTYDVILHAGNQSLTHKENEYYNQSSIVSVIVAGKEIKVYSGLEHYFQRSGIENIAYVNNDEDDGVFLIIKERAGVMDVYSVDQAYPFFPLPGKIEPGMVKFPVIK